MAQDKELNPSAGSAEVLVRNQWQTRLCTFLETKPTLAAAISGLLVAFSFAGFSQFYLVFFGLVGLIAAVLGAATPKAAAKAGFAYGMVLSLVNHHWMLFVRMPAPIGYVLAAIIIGGFFAIWAWLSRGPGKGHPIVAILGYGCLELLVNLGPFSFGWYTLGYTQWNNFPLLPTTAIIGAHGLSLLILGFNYCIWAWLKNQNLKLGLGALIGLALMVFLPGQINSAWAGNDGGMRFWAEMSSLYRQVRGGAKPKTYPPSAQDDIYLVVVQINVSNEEKELPSQTERIVQAHIEEAHKALKKVPPDHEAMVVFPETFVAAYLEDDQNLASLWEHLKSFARINRVWLAMGLNDVDFKDQKQLDRNAFVLINPKGKLVNRYFKRNLVPFGEYVPLRSLIDNVPPLSKWVSTNVFPYDNVPGEKLVLFNGPGKRKFFSPICFETSFPWMFRQAAQKGATWVLTPTNDSWFGNSFLAVQHMAQGVVRAMESGLTVVQASNSGISYATSQGHILWQTGVMEKSIVVKPLLNFEESLNFSRNNPSFFQNHPKTIRKQTIYTHIGGFLESFVLLFYPFSLLWIALKTATIKR